MLVSGGVLWKVFLLTVSDKHFIFPLLSLSRARDRSLYLPIYRDKKVTKSYIVCNYPLKHPWHVTLWPYLAPGYLIHGFALRTDPQAKTNLA